MFGDVTTRAVAISLAKLGGRDRSVLYLQVKALAEHGKCSGEIAGILKISYPSCYNWAKHYNDKALLTLLKENSKQAKSEGLSKSLKGRTSPLKGRNYQDILGSEEAATARAKVTSDWMKTDKNIRRFCQVPSKPQLLLFERVREAFPDAALEYPVTFSRGLTLWLDIAIPSRLLDIEYDGDYWHDFNETRGRMKDSDRDKLLEKLGWQTIRVKESQDQDSLLSELVKSFIV